MKIARSRSTRWRRSSSSTSFPSVGALPKMYVNSEGRVKWASNRTWSTPSSNSSVVVPKKVTFICFALLNASSRHPPGRFS